MRYIEANVKMRSIAPFAGKPEVFTIGGFYATTADGRDFIFDWENYTADISYDDDGRIVFDVWLYDFDEIFIKDSQENQENAVSFDEITAEFLSEIKFTEIFYECYIADSDRDSDFLRLELSDFVITQTDANTNASHENSFKVPQIEIDRYNRGEGLDFNFNLFEKMLSNKKNILDEIKAILKTEEDIGKRIALITNIIDNNFSAEEKLVYKNYSLSTYLSYLLYYYRKTTPEFMQTDYVVIHDFVSYCEKRSAFLENLS